MARTVHLLVRDTGPAPRIACGRAVSALAVLRRQVTHDPDEAACFDCARFAPDLTELQRQIIWDRKCEGLASARSSPWEVAKSRAERAERRRLKAEAKARRAAERAKAAPF